jgi:SNF2 family DNA or RNA helicase/uncharacterized Zn finger protein
MAKTYGVTFWGAKWLSSVKSIFPSEFNNRDRGEWTKVKFRDVRFDHDWFVAKVKISSCPPFDVKLKLRSFTEVEVFSLENILFSKPLMYNLKTNKLSEKFFENAENFGVVMFPKTEEDLLIESEVPLKKPVFSALLYKIAEDLDNDPFWIFRLHGVDMLKRISKGNSEVEDEVLIDYSVEQKMVNSEGFVAMPDCTKLHDLKSSLLAILPSNPSFYNEGDFRSLFEEELFYVADKACKKIIGESRFYSNNTSPIKKEFDCNEIRKNGRLAWEDFRVIQQLLDLPEEVLVHLKKNTATLKNVLEISLSLISKGCVVPCLKTKKSQKKIQGGGGVWNGFDCEIVWRPALFDTTVLSLVKSQSQNVLLWEYIITFMIDRLARQNSNEIFRMFFHRERYFFYEHLEILRGIRFWLLRLHFDFKKKISFVVDENGEDFFVRLEVDDIPFELYWREKGRMEEKEEVLDQLSFYSDVIKGLEAYLQGEGVIPMHYDLNSFASFLDTVSLLDVFNVETKVNERLTKIVKPKLSVHVKISKLPTSLNMEDVLDFDWRVAIGDDLITKEEFDILLASGNELFLYKNKYVRITKEDVKTIKEKLKILPTKVDLLHSVLSGEYEGATISCSSEVESMKKNLTEIQTVSLPKHLNAKLRPYQERGFYWMYRNFKCGYGSILADDMGLGKTLQVITLILKLREEKKDEEGKFLVVAPTSLLYNWQMELKKFAPSLKVSVFHGQNRNLSVSYENSDVVLVPYSLIIQEVDNLKHKNRKWHLLVIDEAQKIKNPESECSVCLKKIKANSYLALSGTPVENKLAEYWSIMDFVNHRYLGTLSDFEKKYAIPIQKNEDKSKALLLKKICAPFMLRRLKSDKNIISDLPEKIETNIYVRLSKYQAVVYQKLLNHSMKSISDLKGLGAEELKKRVSYVLALVQSLKKTCNHPCLVDGRHYDENPGLSGKTEALLDLMETILSSGEKVLIFTQFVQTGDLLRKMIEEKFGEKPLFFNGGVNVKERNDMVANFQSCQEEKVLILTLQSGGVGLNLTAACNVIHFDLWWNPAVENQATDRAYRIGQRSDVCVYRFITKGTFEEKLDEIIQAKKGLADMVVGVGENWVNSKTDRELHEFFKYEEEMNC